MDARFLEHLRSQLAEVREAGLFKAERVITTPQNAWIETTQGRRVVNFCANNYLGLADHPDVVAAAHEALDRYGYGMASVRFICGTQSVHKELEGGWHAIRIEVRKAGMKVRTRPGYWLAGVPQ